MSSEAAGTREVFGKVGQSWGWLLGFGLLTLLAGILALVWPGPTVLAIAVIFGAQLLVGGLFWFVSALSETEKISAAQILLAVLAIVAGVLVLRSPVESALLFPLVLGLFWLVSGVVETFHAIVRETVTARGWAIAAGVLSVLAGIALLVYPGLGLVTLTYLLGAWLVVYGVITSVRAVQLRPHGASQRAPHAGPAHA